MRHPLRAFRMIVPTARTIALASITSASITSASITSASIALARPVSAQAVPAPAPGTATVSVVPGARYAAGGTHRSLLGGGYRDLWATAIEVPVADLSRWGNGLTPEKLGGGMTTRTLHLKGADGRRYVFRSVDKSPVEFEDFAGSILDGIIQDQVASFHPTGAPVVAALLDAVGVLHPDPVFAVVPDDPRLGPFREEFAGMLVLVEERPDDGPNKTAGFAGSRKIVQTDKLFRKLDENPHHRVDAEELLRARLVDLLVGDRDRSHNNHLWARFDVGSSVVWRVIPRDRDQAFIRFDGAFKRLARSYERRLVSFDDAYPDMLALTRNAWDIDRRLLVGLDREQWDRVVREVQDALSDTTIADAVRRMPPEHVSIIGEEMTRALLRRRDELREAAEDLYRVVFSVADVQGSDQADEMRLTRGVDGFLTITLGSPSGDGAPMLQRTFSGAETSEIRVYLHDGDDTVILDGPGWDGILVRIMGGDGHDTLRDETFRLQPRTILYDSEHDSGPGSPIATSETVTVRRSSPQPPLSWFEDRRDLDWGSLTIPRPTASYDKDRGLMLAPGLVHDRYGFARQPYSERLQLSVGWAVGLQEPLIDFRYLGRALLAGADLSVRFRWSGMEIINFYGYGNETAAAESTDYHRVAHKQVMATVAARFGGGEHTYLEVGPTFTYTSTDTATANSHIAASDPYGSGKFSHAGLRAAFAVDTRDHEGTPTRGVRVAGGASVYPAFLDAVEGFRTAHIDAAAYLSPEGGNPVLATRIAGKRASGAYPFTEAAFLGGPRTVRSIREQRYAGDGMLLGSAELRVELGRVVFPVPMHVGLFGLADAGRVYHGAESSGSWHTALGGGIWFALLNRSDVAHLSVAHGNGRTAIHAGVGFAF